jgi:hypothetical protein
MNVAVNDLLQVDSSSDEDDSDVIVRPQRKRRKSEQPSKGMSRLNIVFG